ncbi:MAG: hypothetical protein HWD82_04335 [Flavobacteriaceae bacterium]|nr:hypothetical protein [Flavobacteriaceae bacterium]
MKIKNVIFILLLSFSTITLAQDNSDALSKGSWVIEANTGAATTGNTSFSLSSSNGNTNWSIGFDGGYFVMDNLAVKAGLGYLDLGGADAFSYKFGAEYFLGGQFPVSVDFTGSTGNDLNWLGLQAGYAWFVADNISIKPAFRYNIGLDDQDGLFQGLIGFSLFF